MTKFEKIWNVCVAVSALCIVAFWITCYNGNLSTASYLFAAAGIFAFAALASLAAQYLHKKRYGF